jgi:hypothetical protein
MCEMGSGAAASGTHGSFGMKKKTSSARRLSRAAHSKPNHAIVRPKHISADKTETKSLFISAHKLHNAVLVYARLLDMAQLLLGHLLQLFRILNLQH